MNPFGHGSCHTFRMHEGPLTSFDVSFVSTRRFNVVIDSATSFTTSIHEGHRISTSRAVKNFDLENLREIMRDLMRLHAWRHLVFADKQFKLVELPDLLGSLSVLYLRRVDMC